MTKKEMREQVVQDIADELRRTPFTFEFKVVKRPKGIKVIREVTREQLDMMITKAKQMKDENGKDV